MRWTVLPAYEQALERVIISAVDLTQRKLAEEAEQQARDFNDALQAAEAVLRESLDFDQVLDRVLDQLHFFAPYDGANILMIDQGVARPLRVYRV